MEERIQKIIAQSGRLSRRKAEQAIRLGRVSVNGHVIRELGTKVRPGKDKVALDFEPIKISQKKRIVILNKPRQVMTTKNDPEGRQTVMSFIPKEWKLNPVGRLEYDSEGLLILTDDGELIQKLTHRKFRISKTYVAKVRGVVTETALQKLRQGMRLEDGFAKFDKVEVTEKRDEKSVLTFEFTQGRNQMIRHMMLRVGHPVLRLRRTQIGSVLKLGKLPYGHFRELTDSEIEELYLSLQITKASRNVGAPARKSKAARAQQQNKPQ